LLVKSKVLLVKSPFLQGVINFLLVMVESFLMVESSFLMVASCQITITLVGFIQILASLPSGVSCHFANWKQPIEFD